MTSHDDHDQYATELTQLIFQEHDLALLEVLQSETTSEQIEHSRLDELAKATGVRDEQTLQMLLDRGITSEKAAALALIPLVAVAWADGRLQDAEIKTLLSAAHEQGVSEGTPAYELFHRWLLVEPSRSLRAAWANYVMSLCNHLTDEQRESLRQQTLDRAVTIARAAGGFLGLGNKVSEGEAAILEELSLAFERGSAAE
jgi:hypothetical protein